MNRPLLKVHALFRSRDLDEAREKGTAVFCPHRLETLGARSLFDARQHHLPGRHRSLNYIEYGARTLIAAGELGEFYLLQIPLEGGAEITNGRDCYLFTPDRAANLNPHLPARMTMSRNWRGTTPLTFWREAWLARAHADLLAAPPGTTVTEVALRWGFTHVGRFSQLYRARYGLCPRDRLKG